jgi:hypothetical protein
MGTKNVPDLENKKKKKVDNNKPYLAPNSDKHPKKKNKKKKKKKKKNKKTKKQKKTKKKKQIPKKGWP